MTIKVQCHCGTKFAFDLDPVPPSIEGPIPCPACGADGTVAVNAFIAQAQEAPQPNPDAGRSKPLRIGALAVPAAESSAIAPKTVVCSKHPREEATAHCHACGKPICSRCMERYGSLCSVYCQEQAQAKNLEVPVYAGHRTILQSRQHRRTRLVALATAAAVLTLIGSWIWYAFFGSKPVTALVVAAPAGNPVVHAEWAGAGQFLVLTKNSLALHGTDESKPVWLTDWDAGAPRPSSPFEPAPETLVRVTENKVWILSPNQATAFDLKSGQPKERFALSQPARQLAASDRAALAISPAGPGQMLLTKIDLDRAAIETAHARVLTRQHTAPGAFLGASEAPASAFDDFFWEESNAAQLSVRLLESRLVHVQEQAPKESPTIFERKTVRASDGAEAAAEFLRRPRGGGSRTEDQSRYHVTLRRIFKEGAPEWAAEVVGRPAFFPLNTVDLLVAGKTLQIFDKQNRQLWTSNLPRPLHVTSAGRDATAPVCHEQAGRLYFHGDGTLRAFRAQNGDLLWELPGVGAAQLIWDTRGSLYVVTSPGLSSYGEDPPFEGVASTLFKVNPATGTVLWEQSKVADVAAVSGKFLYGWRASVSNLDLFQASQSGEDAPVHFRIHRLDPKTGQQQWEWSQKGAPERVHPYHNELLVQNSDEVRILRFLSL